MVPAGWSRVAIGIVSTERDEGANRLAARKSMLLAQQPGQTEDNAGKDDAQDQADDEKEIVEQGRFERIVRRGLADGAGDIVADPRKTNSGIASRTGLLMPSFIIPATNCGSRDIRIAPRAEGRTDGWRRSVPSRQRWPWSQVCTAIALDLQDG
jgi:hypothetical protein